jgi:signal transduction histidine kinase
MYQAELVIFIIVISAVIAVFLSSIFLFVHQYKQKKIAHEQEKKLLTEQHRNALITSISEIQQQTMKDIGLEIHDNIGQKLVLASIYTQQIQHEQQFDAEKITRITNEVNESLAMLRNLSKSLTDDSLEKLSLEELLQRELEKVNASKICVATLQMNTLPIKAGYKTKLFVLRIVQEFIQNSLKHANCKNILIDLSCVNELVVKLIDDGMGFNTNEENESGIGLSNMKQRAALLGAAFSLTSVLNSGTELLLIVPATQIAQ